MFSKLHSQPTSFGISAVVAHKPDILNEVKTNFASVSALGHKPLIVDCDFKYASRNDYLDFVPLSERILIDPNDLVNLDYEELISVTAIQPLHEMSAWESMMTNTNWRDWLRKMANQRPVILLSTPIDIIEGQKHNSFLEVLFAETLLYRANSRNPST